MTLRSSAPDPYALEKRCCATSYVLRHRVPVRMFPSSRGTEVVTPFGAGTSCRAIARMRYHRLGKRDRERPTLDLDGGISDAIDRAWRAHGERDRFTVSRSSLRDLKPDVILTRSLSGVCAFVRRAAPCGEEFDLQPDVLFLPPETSAEIVDNSLAVAAPSAGLMRRSHSF